MYSFAYHFDSAVNNIRLTIHFKTNVALAKGVRNGGWLTFYEYEYIATPESSTYLSLVFRMIEQEQGSISCTFDY